MIATTLGPAFGGHRIILAPDRGLFGYAQRDRIAVETRAGIFEVGSLFTGGDSQRNRAMFQLTGSGCALVVTWPGLANFLRALDARLTRVDLAADFPQGELSIELTLRLLQRGDFDVRGRRPESRLAGDWIGKLRGRTAYVGSVDSGKTLRVYEKGRQLGDPLSPWVRAEVQLGNRRRLIPYAVLTEPETYFAGAYPALADLLGVAGKEIPTRRKAAAADIARRLGHLSHSYGSTLDQAMRLAGATAEEVIAALRVPKLPRGSFPVTSAEVSPTWSEVRSAIHKS